MELGKVGADFPSEGSSAKNMVHSLAKGLRVLEAFTADRPELSQSDAAKLTDMDNATAFRMLNTLVVLGYVAKVPGTRRYRLTLKPLDLGFNAIARTGLKDLARPVLRSLVGEVNEAASLGVLEGTEIVYVERVQAGLARMGVDIRVGTRIPAITTAIGQALLAYLPKQELEQIIGAVRWQEVGAGAPVSPEQLHAQLADVRKDGVVLKDWASVNGLRVLAAPILDRNGSAVASISVAAPAMRTQTESFVEAVKAPLIARAG